MEITSETSAFTIFKILAIYNLEKLQIKQFANFVLETTVFIIQIQDKYFKNEIVHILLQKFRFFKIVLTIYRLCRIVSTKIINSVRYFIS